ncbi:hypothetical protein AB6N28_00505 [Moraxella osloensis]|jgi:DNA-directed RNA polymerase subunit RPC12/RpoP|uniref:hypothetical protein n=1 Tax=Faucicola osloensis TaxID=34062 RepID=UPI001F8A3E09|nr:protein L [Escherichia coli]
MAITTQQNKNSIDIATSSDAFNKSYNAGNHADYSGIYKCSKCGREIAHNKDDNPLPTHYRNNNCSSPNWKLFIYAEN